MSKSKGNVIDPLDIIDQGYGADTLRTYEMFIGPYDMDAAWDPKSVGGVYRFLNRCYTLVFGEDSSVGGAKGSNISLRHKTIKKVTDDIHRQSFNTAVSAMMEYVNELYKVGPETDDLITLAKLLKPFAPHLASEMLEKLGADDVWPVWDEKYLVDDTVELVVQVNGKVRAKLQVSAEILENQPEIEELALADEHVKKYTASGVKKIIYVKKAKLVNIVA